MSAGICTFHRVRYLGSACPACVAQNRFSKTVIDLREAKDERDAVRKAAEERGVTLEIEDDVEF